MRNAFTISGFLYCLFTTSVFTSCKKLVEVPDPRNTVTTAQVFVDDIQAESALAGLYTVMINGETGTSANNAGTTSWAAGLSTIVPGLSAGEIFQYSSTLMSDNYALATNRVTLLRNGPATNLWKSAYKAIYIANSIIEGVAASESSSFSATGRKEITAEAKFVRAFAYFYLVNLFGDVPLVLTVDFNQTRGMTRTAQQDVYKQIIADLTDARADLRPDYSRARSNRSRPNKWAATALLARVQLFLKDYPAAAALATEVIDENLLYGLETDPGNTFRAASREAIWQLKQTSADNLLRNATPEGYQFYISNKNSTANFILTDHLISSFEENDKRRQSWVDSTDKNLGLPNSEKVYIPAKYKIGQQNAWETQRQEVYVMLRLAEMFLVRSEARANGAAGGTAAAVSDLNVIRHRAGLDDLPEDASKDAILEALEKERFHEYFAEWGHRWLDLKRTGRVTAVMQTIPIKNPWEGDYQLLYPIPQDEIRANIYIRQNPGYTIQN